MKLFWISLLFLSVKVNAQTTISIATDHTVSLIFPFPVKHVDKGTADILVQPVKEQENILLLKAATNELVPTNLTVITSEGTVHSFAIRYSARPAVWVYCIPASTQANMAAYANSILDNPRTMTGIRDRSWDMQAIITGIYIKNNVIYYQLRLDNQSPIDYDIELLRFFIRDKKKGKRTATQENELTPLYAAGNIKQVRANSQNVVVVALEKFTIPDAKYLIVQVHEHNGGRHLQMKVSNNKISKAIPLPDLK